MNGTGGFLYPEEVVRQLNIKRWMKVADFGCGSGYFTIPIAKRLVPESRIYAIDILDSALEAVRSRAKLQGVFNVETIRCDLEKPSATGLTENSIDLVLLANILFQADQKAAIIREARRILKTGGELVIIDWEPNQPMGPPKELIVPLGAIKQIAEDEGFKFKQKLSVDKYHWGLIFEK